MARRRNLFQFSRGPIFAESGLPLQVEHVKAESDLGLHVHDFSELVIVLSGQAVHGTDDTEYTIGAGDVFVILGDMAHGYQNPQDFRYVQFLFDAAQLGLPTTHLGDLAGYHVLFELEPGLRRRHRFRSRLRISCADLDHVTGLAQRIENEIARKESGYRFMAAAAFMEVVGFLSRCYSDVREGPSQALTRISEVTAYLERSYAEPVTLGQLARIAHMSQSTLQRAFRKALDVSPIDYSIRLRVHKAADMLRTQEVSVTEAAFHVGFQDSNYFSRQFRQIMGVSPREFRRRS